MNDAPVAAGPDAVELKPKPKTRYLTCARCGERLGLKGSAPMVKRAEKYYHATCVSPRA